MKEYQFQIKINTYRLIVQVIQMHSSYYIYIGSQQLIFQNLKLAIQTKYDHLPTTKDIIPFNHDYDEPYADQLAKSISKKLNSTIYLSINLHFDHHDQILKTKIQQELLNNLFQIHKSQ